MQEILVRVASLLIPHSAFRIPYSAFPIPVIVGTRFECGS